MKRSVWLIALVLVLSVIPLVGASAAGFVDTGGSVFKADIDWLAAQGITKGCNPPTNDKFCPNAQVTRGQMAAFLTRALKLPAAPKDYFTDDTGSVFENDINRLAASGITKGCNPPTNNKFCPNGKVTRGQMAAFLSRAYKLPATKSAPFKDAAGTFYNDINRLAAAGITKGCNPPTNDMYCPNGLVTRGQMAAFLHRAFKFTPPPPPPPGGDTVKPVITIIGANPVSVQQHSPYGDKGASATDNVDGDISHKIVPTNKVNTAVLGTYTVTYNVKDAAGNAAVPKVRTVKVVKDAPPPPPPPPGAPPQVNHFLTGYSGPGSLVGKLTVPAIDPAGVAYHTPSDHLFIVDSEINEANVSDVWGDVGANVFEVSRDGSTLHSSWDLPGMDPKREPTGIAYDANAGVFYVTNDETKKLYRYTYNSTTGFTLDDSVSTRDNGSNDVEGVTVDGAGNIYVIDQKNALIAVYTYGTGFTFVKTMPLSGFATVPETPEGIGYDAATGHLFVVSGRGSTVGGNDPAMFEYTTAGAFVDWYSLAHFSPLPAYGTAEHNLTQPEAAQGITFGPATSGASPTFYLADGGVDNGNGDVGTPTTERDGVIYEGRLP